MVWLINQVRYLATVNLLKLLIFLFLMYFCLPELVPLGFNSGPMYQFFFAVSSYKGQCENYCIIVMIFFVSIQHDVGQDDHD